MALAWALHGAVPNVAKVIRHLHGLYDPNAEGSYHSGRLAHAAYALYMEATAIMGETPTQERVRDCTWYWRPPETARCRISGPLEPGGLDADVVRVLMGCRDTILQYCEADTLPDNWRVVLARTVCATPPPSLRRARRLARTVRHYIASSMRSSTLAAPGPMRMREVPVADILAASSSRTSL